MMFSDPLVPGKLYYLTTHSKRSVEVYKFPEDPTEEELVGEIDILDCFVYLGRDSAEGLELVLLTNGVSGWMDVWWSEHHFSEVVTEKRSDVDC